MDSQSLGSVLGILRLLRPTAAGTTAYASIRSWAGAEISEAGILKVASYIIEQASLAQQVVDYSQLSEEAKAGVRTTISGVSTAFSLERGNSSWSQWIVDVNGGIANLVILLSALGLETDRPSPSESLELASEVEKLFQAFDDEQLDPIVRDIAKRHLQVLATMLRHVPIFGLEGALSTYFELMMKLRRADVGTTPAAHSKLEALFLKIKTWGGRLSALDKAWNAGARLIAHAGKAQDLLEYIPDVDI